MQSVPARYSTAVQLLYHGSSSRERADTNARYTTMQPLRQRLLCLGGALALTRVLALGGVLCRELSAGHDAHARASYVRFVARDTQHRRLDASDTSF
jgi:hypothetical protein